MSDTVISVEGLGKRYTLGASKSDGRYTALRDVLAQGAKSVARRVTFRSTTADARPPETDFWALKDVSFEVKQGEVLGIIGRNGAGKSTLLKILSRITEPTQGRITIKGRVASLLEVGTGFHPELTGRENIFLNGAILGMHRSEIKAKFDEIVAFAEVEKFLDTPVKRYSSGMYVRLAFAVAAHLEPEILIVDEVLAVGDAQFQQKCLGKMNSVAKAGRTVIFVSHNMDVINKLCTGGIYLQKGSVGERGSVTECISHYLSASADSLFSRNADGITVRPVITQISVDAERLAAGDLQVDLDLISPHPLKPPIFGIVVYNEMGTPVYGSNMHSHPDETLRLPFQNGQIRLELRGLPLQTGFYTASVFLGDESKHYVTMEHVLRFFFVNPAPPAKVLPMDMNGSLNWPARWTLRTHVQ